MKAAQLQNFNITHISTSTGFKRLEGRDRLISAVIVDFFKSPEDPEHFVEFKVELINPKRLFQECEINLN